MSAGRIEIKAIKRLYNNDEEEKLPLLCKEGRLPCPPFRWLICGASKSGKTNLLLFMLTQDSMYKNYFEDGTILISGTAHIEGDTKSCLDNTYDVLGGELLRFHPNRGIEVIERLFEMRKEAKSQGMPLKPALIILDDCISFKKFMNHQEFLRLFVMGRHLNVSTFILSQVLLLF